MTNDSIDAKGTRAKALGAIGHKCANLGRKGARPLMSMHGWGLGIVATGILNTFLTIKSQMTA